MDDRASLASNNPFRSSALSPEPKNDDVNPRERPLSRNNPFLDAAGGDGEAPDTAKKLFKSLVETKERSSGAPGERRPERRPDGKRPPGRGPPPGWKPRPDRPGERRMPMRPKDKDVFADPRPRRNSESSIYSAKAVDDKVRREPSKAKPRKDKDRLDVIDKLDVTGIYGPTLFHHDGPFDACNPHRNRNARRAPMKAFPKDSANNALGGPVPQNIDRDKFFGNTPEAFSDYNAKPVQYKSKASVYDAQMEQTVHGEESLGLGTSTFLEGAPASRTAIQRRESEPEAAGLSRTKSLAQRIKSVRRPEGREGREPRESRVPRAPRENRESREEPMSPQKELTDEYAKAWDQKAAEIEEPTRKDKVMSVQRQPIERRVTDTGVDSKPSGFLNRVKSLKKKDKD